MKFLPQPTDFRNALKGVSRITNWFPYIGFFESQLIHDQDSDGCEFFTTQESFDAQMNYLIANNLLPGSLITLFKQLGFMDANSLDEKEHFHSSPRFLQIQSGLGFNGASIQTGWDVIRKFGCLPWTELPVDNTLTPEQYLAPVSQDLLNKAFQFLLAIGGKLSVSYQWISDDTENVNAMISGISQAPLCLGVVTDQGWNQQYPTPPPSGADPNHAVMCYAVTSNDFSIYDHYQPASKELVNYPVLYAFQGILNPVPPPPAPIPPAPIPPSPSPTPVQELYWFQQIVNWLQSIIGTKVGSTIISMNTSVNVFLLTAATGLVSVGVTTITSNLTAGAIEIVLGIVAFISYEVFPPSTPTS